MASYTTTLFASRGVLLAYVPARQAALTIVYFCRGHPRLSENDETLASAKTAAAAGFAWGALRRLIAWRQQGEHFAFARAGVGSVAPGRLPRVLASGRAAVAGGLKASFGAALLTALYGVFGVRFFLRDETLDAPTGRNGTVAMSCARTGVDLGGYHLLSHFVQEVRVAVIGSHFNRRKNSLSNDLLSSLSALYCPFDVEALGFA